MWISADQMLVLNSTQLLDGLFSATIWIMDHNPTSRSDFEHWIKSWQETFKLELPSAIASALHAV